MTSILGNEWHLSSAGSEFLTENGTINDKQKIYNFALNTELKEICLPVLHEFTNNEIQKTVFQIHKIRNISAPKANEESQAAPRLLKLTLTDGETYIQALELSTIGTISLKNTPPGTKLLIENAKICSGYILLTPQNCKVLGGKVASLIEKWEVTKSVQRNRRNNNNNEDGPPPWVNFGTKIISGVPENNFQSLLDKSKDPKETSEFDQQRQDAILEASAGAVRKVFSGRVKQNVQAQSANSKKNFEKPKEKKEQGKIKGKALIREKEIDERPQKPSEKVSLFAFLEDKLPVSNTQDNFYQVQPNRNIFKEIDSTKDDTNKYDYNRKKTSLPKQFEKPDYNKKNQNQKKIENSRTDNSSVCESTPNSTDMLLKKSNSSIDKPKYSNSNSQSSFNTNDQKSNSYPQQNNNYPRNSLHNANTTNDQYKQKSNSYSQQNSSYPQQNTRYHPNSNDQFNYKSNPYPQQNNAYPHNYPQHFNFNDPYKQNYSRNSYPQQMSSYSQNYVQNSFQNNQPLPLQRADSNNQNLSNFNKRPYQKQTVQNDVNHMTHEVQKMSVNSQFASRSLRQHLNLGVGRKNEDGLGNSNDSSEGRMNVGDEIMAKYWEDGKYYNATIISITDKTFAVRFKGYGNIEEILKTDCHPISSSNNTRSNFSQQSDKINKQYSGD